MANVSALVVSWTMVIRTVVTSIRHNSDVVASGAEAVFYPDGPPESGRLRALLIAMADTLERLLEELATREKELEMERGDDPAVREDDRSAYSALRARIIRTRSIIDGAFGPAIAAKLGFTGETPENEDALAQYAGTAIEALRAGVLPEPGDDGVTIDAGRLADQNRGGLDGPEERTARGGRRGASGADGHHGARRRGSHAARRLRRHRRHVHRVGPPRGPPGHRRSGPAHRAPSRGAARGDRLRVLRRHPTHRHPGHGAQDTGGQSTGGQSTGAQSTGAQGGSAPSGAEKKLVDGSTGG